MTRENKEYVNELAEKRRRHDAILEIIQNEKMKSQQDIVDALARYGIDTVQGTVSLDLKALDIAKGNDNSYQISTMTLQLMHIDELERLINTNSPVFYNDVQLHYMKVKKGNASLYAFHFRQAFPETILEITIKEEGLLMLVDMNNAPPEFLRLLKS